MPPPRALSWHEWAILDPGGESDQESVDRCSKCFKVSYGDDRPMPGCSGPPAALRRLQGAESERGHLLCTSLCQTAECDMLILHASRIPTSPSHSSNSCEACR
eukprot:9496947-Pyramimonas_sp.AAC.1